MQSHNYMRTTISPLWDRMLVRRTNKTSPNLSQQPKQRSERPSGVAHHCYRKSSYNGRARLTADLENYSKCNTLQRCRTPLSAHCIGKGQNEVCRALAYHRYAAPFGEAHVNPSHPKGERRWEPTAASNQSTNAEYSPSRCPQNHSG